MPQKDPSQADITIDLVSSSEGELRDEISRLVQVMQASRQAAAQSPASATGGLMNIGSAFFGNTITRIVGSLASLYATLKEMQERSEQIRQAAADADRARYNVLILERQSQIAKLRDVMDKAKAQESAVEKLRREEAAKVRSGQSPNMNAYNILAARHQGAINRLNTAQAAYQTASNAPPPVPGSAAAGGAGAGGIMSMASRFTAVAGAAGAVVTAFQQIYAAGKQFYNQLDRSAQEFAQYNSQIAIARAEQQQQLVLARIRRAELQSEELTKFTRQQTRAAVSWESISGKLENAGAKLLNPILERAASIMELADDIMGVASDLGVTADNVFRILAPMYDIILGISKVGEEGWKAILDWLPDWIQERRAERAKNAAKGADDFFNQLLKVPDFEAKPKAEKPPDPLRGVIF